MGGELDNKGASYGLDGEGNFRVSLITGFCGFFSKEFLKAQRTQKPDALVILNPVWSQWGIGFGGLATIVSYATCLAPRPLAPQFVDVAEFMTLRTGFW
jgi:hypothetical protein